MRLLDRLLHKVIFPHGLSQKAGRAIGRPNAGQVVREAAKEVFQVTGTRYLPDGFVIEGYARLGGVTLPAKTAVTMRSVPSSRGEWGIRPEHISIAGVPAGPALKAVKLAMAADPRLKMDGDVFVVQLSGAKARG
ncbi:MAG: hypothetical protein VKP62_04600 [Candidatus Sericytochromatia bacterium]|nr:hypothetical protein [Candidatus Sericytochromatia bacterium]